MPNIRWLLALITSVHRFVYRLSGGRVGSNLGGSHMLLLKHTGRKTGLERITPLLYVEDAGRFILVASNAGDDRHPAWWLNVKSRPEVSIQVGRTSHPVRAREADAAERERLWPLLDSSYTYFPGYRERTSREIPIVILEPIALTDPSEQPKQLESDSELDGRDSRSPRVA
jgi:deazaflavin-dependent oxidoreductase (nitroreductase family)